MVEMTDQLCRKEATPTTPDQTAPAQRPTSLDLASSAKKQRAKPLPVRPRSMPRLKSKLYTILESSDSEESEDMSD